MANNVTDLGKVGMTLKGEWNSSTSYERLDTVTYEGSLYIAVKDNVGSQPSESNTNWMLGAKHGEFTEQQLEDFKAEVVAESKEEMDDYTDDKKTELDTYTGTKKTELDTYEGTKETELNIYASGLKDDFDSNATSKTNAFNTNATSKTTAFDNNATAKTTAFDTNASTKTSAFDDNATAKTTAFDENAEEKTGDFNDNVDTKTTEFDAHVEEKETEFDENVDSIQEQITDIQEFIDSELEQGITEKGTRADVSDSAKWYGELAPEGRTEQKQLSGKNLFDKNTMSTRYNRFMPNPTVWTISSADDAYSIAIPCLPNKTYTLSHKNTNATFFRIGYINVNPIPTSTSTNIEVYNGYRGENIFERTIQTGEDATFIIFQANMAEMSNTLETLQLEEGDTATDYEPYVGGTASPNPDYPQEIRNVEGRSCRNLFDGEIELGSINPANGNLVDNSTRTRSKNFIKVKPNTTYTITRQSGAFRWIVGYTADKTGINDGTFQPQYPSGIIQLSKGAAGETFTTTATTEYIKWYDTDCTDLTEEVMLNEGSAALPYEPYFEGKRLEFNVCNKNLAKEEFDCYLKVANKKIVASTMRSAQIIKVKPSTKYVVDGDFSVFTNGVIRIAKLSQFPQLGDSVGTIIYNSNQFTFTTDTNTHYILLYNTVDKNINCENLDLEEGVVLSEYTPQNQQLIPFPLQDGQKLMKGDYLAEDGVHHVRGKTILPNATKLNAITLGGVAGQYVTYSLQNGKPQGSTASNNFISNKLSYNYNRIKKYTAYTIARSLVVLTDADDTLENFNSNITGSIVEYDLAEETIDPYTEAQQEAYNKLMNLKLYKGVNHIWTETDGLEPNLQLTYYKSNKERLNNIEARLELLEN